VPGHQGRNVGLIDDLQWCSERPPTASDYQWEVYDDPQGKTFGVISTLYHELIALFPDRYFHCGGDEVKAVGPCTVNGSLQSLEHKVLTLLKKAGKTAQGWSELLLVTDGTVGFSDTVINAWQGNDPSDSPANVTKRGYRVVNSNSSVYV
jgi:hexosaminidase